MLLGGIMLSCFSNSYEQNEKNFTSYINKNYHPGDNFYLYAIGKWKEQNPIPEEYSIYGSFNQLDQQNEQKLKLLFDELNKKTNLTEEERKIKLFYNSGLNTDLINKVEIEPIKPLLNEIDQINDLKDLTKTIAKLHKLKIFIPFHLYASADEKNSEMVIAQIFQSGLGLPDRDYYFDQNEFSQKIRNEYKNYIVNLCKAAKLFPISQINKKSEWIYNIEEQLARFSMNRVEMRDPKKLYNKMSLAELQNISPNFSWTLYFKILNKDTLTAININQPEFIKNLNNLLSNISLEQWKAYLQFHLINKLAPYLSEPIEKAHFYFYGTILSGKTKMKERWKKVVSITSENLGEAVGKIYVKKYFPESAKIKMLNLVNNLKQTFAEHIQNLDWMTDATKQKALEKLNTMQLKIGYPEKFKDYSNVDVKEQPFVLNVLAANALNFEFMLSEIDKPVDRTKWEMFPQTVNAYYNPNLNEIVFPAAILQPPFFYPDGDDAINYGAIGAIIGHEMTHGFDDQGKQYDKNGNLNEWWTEQDNINFKNKTEKLIPVFEAYKINDSLSVNGKLTLGENIADLGGISLSLDALKKTLKGNETLIDGLNPLQRFFISYANVWKQNIRQEELLRRLKEDVHSPAEVRVNVPVYQFNEFYEAFNVKPEHKLYKKPEERIKIW
jgi:putative endopeptidase